MGAYRSALRRGVGFAVFTAFFVVAQSAWAQTNPVKLENALPGTTAWMTLDPPAGTIEGYTSEVSVSPGESVHFHVSTRPAARYRVDVYRLGWYGGAGARLIACLPTCSSDTAGVARPVPKPAATTGLVEAGWPVTDVHLVAPGSVSGYYVAKLVLTSGPYKGRAATVPFIVREPLVQLSTILVQASVNTWQAYNGWGGKSLYSFNSTGGIPATHVSFDRPYLPGANAHGFFTWEYQLVRFLEREGYDVSYATDVDTHRAPAALRSHRLAVVAGHGEYWTREMRNGFDAARDAGINLAFVGANIGYWQIRYEDLERTIVAYKSATKDPVKDPALETVRFRDLVPPRPECRLLGVQYMGGVKKTGDPPRNYSVVASALRDPWFTGTRFTSSSRLANLVGYEWDRLVAGCAVPGRPTAFFHYEGTPSDADSVRYVAPSGARVFSAGSLQFTWGLDDWRGHGHPADSRLQQFMRNALADLTRGPSLLNSS